MIRASEPRRHVHLRARYNELLGIKVSGPTALSADIPNPSPITTDSQHAQSSGDMCEYLIAKAVSNLERIIADLIPHKVDTVYLSLTTKIE